MDHGACPYWQFSEELGVVVELVIPFVDFVQRQQPLAVASNLAMIV